MRGLNKILFISALLGGCGPANVLGLLTPKAQRETYDNLVDAARAAYDRGDLPRALKLAKQAHKLDPDAEEAAILYGFVNLSLAHGDPYALAGGLLKYDEEKPADVSPLTALKSVIGLTDGELLTTGTLDTSIADLPVIIPGCAEAVRKQSERLNYLNEALVAVCPYVPIPARTLEDGRQRCYPSTRTSEAPFRALFLWAFSHLSEALVFNGTLSYGSADPTGAKTNLELRVARVQKIDTTAPGNLAQVLGAIDGIRATLDAVMPVSGVCSDAAPTTLLTQTLYDLLTVDLAFAAIPGVPPKMTTAIRGAVDRIKTLQAQSAGDGTDKTKALKADLNKKVSAAIAGKIDEIQAKNAGQITPDQKDKACAAYASISAGASPPPALCAATAPDAAAEPFATPD